MKAEFTKRFFKDLDKLSLPTINKDILETIEQVEKASQLSDVNNIKKLRGHTSAYRIRIGDYRVGLFVDSDVVTFVRLVHRKDIYRVFP